MNLAALRNRLAAFTNDPHARTLVPVIGLLIIATVAVPVLLSRPGTPARLAALPPAPTITTPTAVAITTPAQTRHRTVARVLGHAHNPFVVPSTPASHTVSTTAATAPIPVSSTPAPAAAAPASTATTPARVVTRTVTVTTPTRTPPPRPAPAADPYSFMAVNVTLRREGRRGPARVFHQLSRDQLMPNDLGAFITFLGVESRAHRAVFVLADPATVHGAGRCQRVAGHCRFLILTPHESVTITVPSATGASHSYRFTYAAVQRVTASARIVSVDQMGRSYVRTLAHQLRPLMTVRYDSRTGLIRIRLGRTEPVG